MSDDALFQLGMDLDHGSSTAQTEEKHSQCRASQEDERKDFFCERDGVRYAGTHLIIDLVRAERLDDLEHIEATLRRCVEVAGATLLRPLLELPGPDSNQRPFGYTSSRRFRRAWTISSPYPVDLGGGRSRGVYSFVTP